MNRKTLLAAAAMLREEAKQYQESCRVNGRDWRCRDCTVITCAKGRYDHLCEMAKGLRAAAKTIKTV